MKSYFFSHAIMDIFGRFYLRLKMCLIKLATFIRPRDVLHGFFLSSVISKKDLVATFVTLLLILEVI